MDIIVYAKQKTIDWWKALIAEEELVDRSVLIYKAHYTTPDIAIPLGTRRRSGYVSCQDETIRGEVFRKLQERPLGFPNLRIERPNSHGYRSIHEITWGDDVTDLWLARDGEGEGPAEAHRALGRAFGYKEERIMEMYPIGWRRGED